MDGDKTSGYPITTTSSIDAALNQAIEFLTTPSAKPPAPEAVVEALLQAEKTAKQTKMRYSYAQLLGTWQLRFITGTKQSRQRAGVILGAGRFLPKWVKIHLSYSRSESEQDQGTVQNSVELGPLRLVLTGPTQFWSKTNMLVKGSITVNVVPSSTLLLTVI